MIEIEKKPAPKPAPKPASKLAKAAPSPSPAAQADEDISAPDPMEGAAELLDRSINAMQARWTQGIAPESVGQAFSDWWLHFLRSPGKQMLLGTKAIRKWQRLHDYWSNAVTNGGAAKPCIEPLPQDHRFDGEAWEQLPFGLYQQAFLLCQQWVDAAVRDSKGVTHHHEEIVRFIMRQLLDMLSPANFISTNPVVQQRILATGGLCLIEGMRLFAEDWRRQLRRLPPAGAENFQIGRDLAVTPGKVVFRNELIELLQYAPTTANVRPEPVLIVPAWIMKYYILDLSPENSLVKYLVAQGYTVFIISWLNPGPEHRDFSMETYRQKGVMAALDAVGAITGQAKVHGAGYCLGGTLLAIAAAAMARDNDDRFETLTFLAAQTDFTEPGEIGLFIDEAQVQFLQNMMWQQGYLDSHQMGGAFEMLRSADLIWSHGVQTYLIGERAPMIDLMAWNADGTRMPYQMHSEYLRRLFLGNDLAEGRYEVGNQSIALEDISAPIYVVGTERDHVAPWRSVWKILGLVTSDARFVLTSSGHNGGMVSPPGHPHRHFRTVDRPAQTRHADADAFLNAAQPEEGSWWTDWTGWLGRHSGKPAALPPLGNPDKGLPILEDAPGTYIRQH